LRKKIPALVHSNPLVRTVTGGFTYSEIGHKFGGGVRPTTGGGADYIRVTDHADLNPTDKITVAFWGKFTAPIATQYALVKGAIGSQYEMQIRTTNSIRCRGKTGGVIENYGSLSYTNNVWSSFVYSLDAANQKFNGFVDSVNSLVDVATNGTTIDTTTNPLGIWTSGTAVENADITQHLAWLFIGHFAADQTWVDNYHAGLIDTSDGNDEILLIPFTDNLLDFETNMTSGMFRSD
jgi:hypothetical protein